MAKVRLVGNADAAEFCPAEPYLHILAAASYTLQEGEQPVRLGELYLFSAEKDSKSSPPKLSLTQLYHRETSGIFDIKWRPWSGGSNPCLAQASADGTLHLYRLQENRTSSKTELHESSSSEISSSMCLYVDWSPIASEPQVAVSHSDGSLSIVDVGQSEPEVVSSWDAHGFEAWIVSYDAWKPQIVYSGGDDSQFSCWDLRETQRPVFRDRKTHQMGVCSIQSSPLMENVLITGSYDENVRLWDMRMIQKPLMQCEVELGGGVWRLKWHHSEKEWILAACMHNGFAVARVGEQEIEVLERYKEHASLAYGGSWYRGDWEQTWTAAEKVSTSMHGMNNSGGYTLPVNQDEALVPESTSGGGTREKRRSSSLLVATCSFYDKALHIWEPKVSAFMK